MVIIGKEISVNKHMEEKEAFKIEKKVNLNDNTLLKIGQRLLKKSTIEFQHTLQSHFSLLPFL